MGLPVVIQSEAELERGILELEARYDALMRAIARKDAEHSLLDHRIKQRTEDLAKIEAEIQNVKRRFGV
jgi:hypothetical protein